MDEHYPILDAAFAWLKANPVVTDRIVIVHGDYRSGNYLYDENGIIAMLDWEMAHLGDPMEDLGWASMMFWGREELAGGLMEREAFYRLYEQKTGHSRRSGAAVFLPGAGQREDGRDLPDWNPRLRRGAYVRRGDAVS